MKTEDIIFTVYLVLATASIAIRINGMIKTQRRHKKEMAILDEVCEGLRKDTAAMVRRRDQENTFEMA